MASLFRIIRSIPFYLFNCVMYIVPSWLKPRPTPVPDVNEETRLLEEESILSPKSFDSDATLTAAFEPEIPTPSRILRFPSSGFKVIDDDDIIAEEGHFHFYEGKYCPVDIGDVFGGQYQVVGKLGYGVSSTVWLARCIDVEEYVTLKVYTRDDQTSQQELQNYEYISQGNPEHPGYDHVRSALYAFAIPRAGGDHLCLVQRPMWDSFTQLLCRSSTHRFTELVLKLALIQLLKGLDYLHTECKLVHTDIKSDNILLDLIDKSILDAFTQAELEDPSPRKLVEETTVYASRVFDQPKDIGGVVLSDFGSAVRGDETQNFDAQPNAYRSPEVMLRMEWSYPIDIWNVGVMIWDLFEGKSMFHGEDPDGKGYSTRAHLAEVVGIMGPPPLDMLRRGKRSAEFFDEQGRWIAEVEIPEDTSLEKSEEFLQGENKRMFLAFMRKMLRWRPEDRYTARQLLEDPWLNSQ